MRKMTEARREAILAAAKAVFEEMGFEQATMSEIATREGGSKATLYRYFESKEAIFEELLRRSASAQSGAVLEFLDRSALSAVEDVERAIASLQSSGEEVAAALHDFGSRVLKLFFTSEMIAAQRMVIAAAVGSDAGRAFYENGPAKGLRHLAGYFDRAMRSGHLRRADAMVAALHFRALMESEVKEPCLFNARPALKDKEISAAVGRAVDVFMRAYGPEKRTAPARRG